MRILANSVGVKKRELGNSFNEIGFVRNQFDERRVRTKNTKTGILLITSKERKEEKLVVLQCIISNHKSRTEKEVEKKKKTATAKRPQTSC